MRADNPTWDVKKHSRQNLTGRKTHRKYIDRWSEAEGQTCVHNGAARPKMGASGVVNDPVRLEMGQSRSPGLLTVSWPRDPWLWESLHLLLLPLPFCGYSRSFHCCLNASWHLTGENSCFAVWELFYWGRYASVAWMWGFCGVSFEHSTILGACWICSSVSLFIDEGSSFCHESLE